MVVINVSKDNFQKEVLEEKGVVLVDFYADWCGPCRITGPIIEELAEENKNIKFVKVNVDKNPDLAGLYSVFSIPTFIIFKNGQIVNQFMGALPKEKFLEELKKTK
ncbi:MAG: thioredoxin [Microgenomates group bacterium]|jgi:thioredoxin 1|nr:thioredoxin [Microgenomates group bacterium]